jgi:hypothetical protein
LTSRQATDTFTVTFLQHDDADGARWTEALNLLLAAGAEEDDDPVAA